MYVCFVEANFMQRSFVTITAVSTAYTCPGFRTSCHRLREPFSKPAHKITNVISVDWSTICLSLTLQPMRIPLEGSNWLKSIFVSALWCIRSVYC